MKEVIKARWILPMGAPPLENGVVEIVDGRIVKLASAKKETGPVDEDLGEVIVLPGLINAHCHLDYTGMRGAIPPQKDFSEWIRRINALKKEEDPVRAIGLGLGELRRSGTTSVVNIESYLDAPVQVPPSDLRVWWMGELMDIRVSGDVVAVADAMRRADEVHRHPGGGWGLSPHAPFTASAGLYQSVSRFCRAQKRPWTTHLAETEEEFAMFADASGPLYEFLRDLGRPMVDAGGATPVERLLEADGLPPGGILVHMNILADSDYEVLARRKHGDFSVVHCPNCHDYFSRPKFEIERWRKMGVPVCLGTDSLASNWTLNLFEEMRTLRRSHPGLAAVEILEMVTRNPARALRAVGRLGEISVGAQADLIAIPYDGGIEGVFDAVVDNRSEVQWMRVAGKRC